MTNKIRTFPHIDSKTILRGVVGATTALLALVGCTPAATTTAAPAADVPEVIAPIQPVLTTTEAATSDGDAASRSEASRTPIAEPSDAAEQAADVVASEADAIAEDVATEEVAAVDAAAEDDVDAMADEQAPEVVPVIAQSARTAHCEPTPEFAADADWLDIAIEFITSEEGYDKNWVDIGDGMWTIGYGHAVQKSEPKDVSGPITKEEAADLLRQDLEEMSYIPAVDNWFEEELNPMTYAMMVSFAYNTGPRGFSKYDIPKSDVTAIADAIEHASDHHAEKFPGLICRRAREAYLIRTSQTVAL